MLNQLTLKFRLFSFPIAIEPGFFLICFFLASTMRLAPEAYPEMFAWIFLSILVHELGHAGIGRVFGRKSSIRFHTMGGLTSWDRENLVELSNWKNIWIVLAGPGFGAAFGTLIYLIYLASGWIPHGAVSPEMTLRAVLFFNWGWSILNLVPLFPLDGGQILYYSLRFNSRINAQKVASYVAIGLGGALILLCFYFQEWFGGALIGILVVQNFQSLKAQKDMDLIPQTEEVTRLVQEEKFAEALERLEAYLDEVESTQFRKWGLQQAAVIFEVQNDREGMLAFAEKYAAHLEDSPVLKYHYILAHEGEEAAVQFAKVTYPFQRNASFVSPFLKALVMEGNYSGAVAEYKSLYARSWQFRAGQYLTSLLVESGAYKEGIKVGQLNYKLKANPHDAYNLACAYSRQGRQEQALEWLKKALELGWDRLDHVREDEDLAALRSTPGFEALVRSMEAKLKPGPASG